MKRYYSSLNLQNIKFNFTGFHYSYRLIPLIENIKSGTEMLDVGCGLGTDSILSGILGGKIIGIDINEKSLNLAYKRRKFYENKLIINLVVKFVLRNIFKQIGNYDLIWVHGAISHITPPEKFIKISHNNLKLGGKIIIADKNELNPYTSFYRRKR